ncbi:MAG: lysozyme [Bacteroidia bacterium]|nr:lysozyme [Bacteroidia bacterium]
MKASEKAYSLIRQSEGLRLTAYRCPAGVWTVGYGHTAGVVPGMGISLEQAEAFLRQDIETAEGIVNAEHLNLRQCQFDALVSFVFNIGGGNFRKSTLLMKVKVNPDDNSIMDEFLRWVYAKGKVLPGLQKRRLAEMKLYFSEK